MSGIADSAVDGLPISVVDLETTGLSASGDRIVEIAIVRKEPGQEPLLVLDTLVNPGRRVSATEIHGITDDDVRDAPSFVDIAPTVTYILSGSIFASYNVYFDAKFVDAELVRAGIQPFPPHVCLMYLRPLLDIGPRCSLNDACRQAGVPHVGAHMAADDAMASASLWMGYLPRMNVLGVRTYGDMATRKSYKFIDSFSTDPLPARPQPAPTRLKSRWNKPSTDAAQQLGARPATMTDQDRQSEYWDALKAVIADLRVTPEEVAYLRQKQRGLGLTEHEVRSLHARAFAGLLGDLTDDYLIDDREAEKIAGLADALRALGWAPGDRVMATVPAERRGFLGRLLGS